MYCLTAAEARRAQKPFASTVSLSCPALTTRTCTWAAPGPTRWQLNCGASLPYRKCRSAWPRSEEHTSELQSRGHLVCRLLLEKKKKEEIAIMIDEGSINGKLDLTQCKVRRCGNLHISSYNLHTHTQSILIYNHCIYSSTSRLFIFFFFFNDTATTEIYTLSLHDALPIFGQRRGRRAGS